MALLEGTNLKRNSGQAQKFQAEYEMIASVEP
jgi:hypothetical protein